jgi:hypothetical protein
MSSVRLARTGLLMLALALGLVGCSGTSNLIKPAELAPNPGLLGVRMVWAAKVGQIDFPLDVRVNGHLVALASSDGLVAVLDGRTGAELWRAKLTEPIGAGVGSDGRLVAVAGRSWRRGASPCTLRAAFPLLAGAGASGCNCACWTPPNPVIAAFDAKS